MIRILPAKNIRDPETRLIPVPGYHISDPLVRDGTSYLVLYVMPRILFIGDVVGKPGRKILKEVLPQWQKKYVPDVTIVNVENLAHGKGVTLSTLSEIDSLGIDCFTGGNHIFDKKALSAECFEKYDKLIRPVNYEFLGKDKSPVPGHGYYRFSKPVVSPFMGSNGENTADKSPNYNLVNQQFLVVNLNGIVFMEKQFDGVISNPFLAIDAVIKQEGQKGDIIIVDFHGEATSEKIAMGYYVDGRVSFITGTHTHVATADSRVLPQGTAYITDTGMTGPRDGVIGVKPKNVLEKFLHPERKFKNEIEEDGVLQINGVLIETSDKQQVTRIEKLYKEI